MHGQTDTVIAKYPLLVLTHVQTDRHDGRYIPLFLDAYTDRRTRWSQYTPFLTHISETVERNSMKLDRKQDLNVCVFRADWKNMMAARASYWLRHFLLLLWNRWREFNETWQEVRSQRQMWSGLSLRNAYGASNNKPWQTNWQTTRWTMDKAIPIWLFASLAPQRMLYQSWQKCLFLLQLGECPCCCTLALQYDVFLALLRASKFIVGNTD